MNIADKEFGMIRDFMLNQYGIDLSKKRVLIESRLTQMATQNGYSDFKTFIPAVMSDQSLVQEMVTRLTTNFTFFLRESVHYDFMVQQAIPEMVKERKSSLIKVWSAGCSSGDEAFTAAMYLSEYQMKNPWLVDYKIVGSDISDEALSLAKKAEYTSENLNKLPPTFQKRYFDPLPDGNYRVKEDLKKHVSFTKLNLMSMFPPTFSGFDIIFCRNVMIYFTPEIRKKLAQKYYAALKPGGYLFIGLSESIPAAEVGLKTVRPAIFKREK